MKFADLFTSAAKASPCNAPLRIVRIDEFPYFNLKKNERLGEIEENTCSPIYTKAGIALSALSAPLVPFDAPFVDRQRYREAGASEVATRLPLYLSDPAGPWIRLHGVLLAFQPEIPRA